MKYHWLFLPLFALTGTALAADRPNVVIMLADNLGYGDLGAYGAGEVRGMPTPRIDQLASEGLRLTQFLVEPGCTLWFRTFIHTREPGKTLALLKILALGEGEVKRGETLPAGEAIEAIRQ